jgi:hypothetical protein
MRNYNSNFSQIIDYVNVAPFLYRYENQNFIDKFFETGELYISSFYNYKKYQDNELGDIYEGKTMNYAISESDLTIGSYTSVGINEYSFCTSTILDRSLFKTFSRDSVFRIKDPINFILEVSRSLQRVHRVLHGHCIYLDKKILIEKLHGIVDMETLKSEEGGISFEKLMQISNYVQGLDSYFLKLKQHQHHSEYRILWQTDREIKNGILINCPEATKFCEKINLNELE